MWREGRIATASPGKNTVLGDTMSVNSSTHPIISTETSQNEPPIDVLRNAAASAPQSLQDPLSSSSSDMELANMSPQDAANQMFLDSEILAPMVRASTTPLRTLAISHGASLVYTEELVDRSISSSERIVNTELGTIDYRVPKHSYSLKVQKRMAADKSNPDTINGAVLLRIDPVVECNKLIYQIGTGESRLALEAASRVISDVSGIDINMGCPKKFSVGGGMGSALLSDTKRACDIISTLRRNLSKPVSAKIRLLDPDDPRPTVDFVRALISSGRANAITIHGRIVGDESHSMARWTTLVEVVRQLKQTESVPIIVNGDLYTRADIHEMKRRSSCDGVMLARPALYNVSIFCKGKGEDKTGEGGVHPTGYDRTTTTTTATTTEAASNTDEIPLPEFQSTDHTGYYGYSSPLLHSRTSIVQEYLAHCVRYRAHSKNAKYVVCEMMNNRRAPTNRVPYLNMRFEGGQTIASVCKCRSLDDLIKVWDVKYTVVPFHKATMLMTGETTTTTTTAGMDLHNYDDRYFLDHDQFLRERGKEGVADVPVWDNSKTASSGGEGDEKKLEDGCDVSSPAKKRPKV